MGDSLKDVRALTVTAADAIMEYVAEHKKAAVAYLLLLLAGPVGAHRFYLGNMRQGRAQLMVFGACLVVAFLAFASKSVTMFWIATAIAAALVLWLIVDAFILAGDVQHFNRQLRSELTYRLRARDAS